LGGSIQFLEPHQAILLRKRERTQQYCVHQAEDRSGGADSEGQRKNGGDREAGALAELADGKMQVMEKSLHQVP
jgi:hypothetical protein